MANSIVGVLEQMRFTSLGQLNLAIAELLEVYNDRPVVAFKGRSRNEIFEAEERECLQPLPEAEFAPVTWRKVGVSFDGVVRVRGNFYGVPPRYADRKVAVRIAEDAIEVYTADRRQCIARHPRREDGAETFEGLPGVHPDRFKPLDVWCEEHRRTRILEQWDDDANGGQGPHDCVCRSVRPIHWMVFHWQVQVRGAPSRENETLLRRLPGLRGRRFGSGQERSGRGEAGHRRGVASDEEPLPRESAVLRLQGSRCGGSAGAVTSGGRRLPKKVQQPRRRSLPVLGSGRKHSRINRCRDAVFEAHIVWHPVEERTDAPTR